LRTQAALLLRAMTSTGRSRARPPSTANIAIAFGTSALSPLPLAGSGNSALAGTSVTFSTARVMMRTVTR
jgi:hypothetical protein